MRQQDGGEGGYKDGSPPARQSPRTLRTPSRRDRAGGKGPEGGDGSRETAHLGYEPINKRDAAAQPAIPKLRRGTKPPCSPPFLPCVSQPFREAKAAARGAQGGPRAEVAAGAVACQGTLRTDGQGARPGVRPLAPLGGEGDAPSCAAGRG